MTDELYATDAYLRETDATILDVRPGDERVLLDQTVFFPGGGGQPCDTGRLETDADTYEVTEAVREGDNIWHAIDEGIPPLGDPVRAVIDWDHRYLLMRTHTAMHALCGVVRERYGASVTGSAMEPGRGRLDFDIDAWDPSHEQELEDELNRQLERDLPVEIDFLSREEAGEEPGLIATRVDLLPERLTTIRVVDIVGLDRQADGGTHVASTGEVGRVEITGAESKGADYRRLRIALAEQPDREDAEDGGQEEPTADEG